ncbi:hypothetical protein B7463_g10004, partial [Scytalidium lignicola]
MTKTLVNKGANLDAKDGDSRCYLPLTAASREDSKQKVILLLKARRNHEVSLWTLVDKVAAFVTAFTDLGIAKMVVKHDK